MTLMEYPLLDELVDPVDCTVAVCRCGSAVILAVTAHISKETSRDLTIAAARGCAIRHMKLEETRKLGYGCTCFRANRGHP